MIRPHQRAFRAVLRRWRRLQIAIARLKFELIGQIEIHPRAIVEPKALIVVTKKSKRDWVVKIGAKTKIKDYAYLGPREGFIEIGDNCSVNPYCSLLGYGGITIGNNVRIAAGTSIVAFNHNFEDTDAPIVDQGNRWTGIKIEDDVWIAGGVRILDGVTIGKGSVIGAGSVVNRSIPAYSVAVGVPAKVIKKRGE